MGGFAAEFRGFWVARECDEAIQHAADTAGVIGRKNFLKIFKKGVKKGEKPKNWGAGGVPGCTLYRVCGVIFGSGS